MTTTAVARNPELAKAIPGELGARRTYTDTYVRVCRDSGYGLDVAQACILTSVVLGIDPLFFMEVTGLDLRVMDKIAKGKHPACKVAA